MKAYISEGKNIESVNVAEFPIPKPGPDELLIRIQASALNPADLKVISGKNGGIFLHSRKKPLRLGYDYAGIVEKTGEEVTSIKTGSQVFGFLPYSTKTTGGTFAEYALVKESETGPMPPSLSFEEAAAAATAGLTAYQGLVSLGHLTDGMKVLINGASGGVGTFSVQLAKGFGAEVTGVCSAINKEFVKKIGADEVLDYSKNELSLHEKKYDIIFDVAAKLPLLIWKKLLKKSGTYITTLPTGAFLKGKLLSIFSDKACKMVTVKPRHEDFLELRRLLEEKKISIHLDRIFPFDELRDALSYLANHSVKGKIGITHKN